MTRVAGEGSSAHKGLAEWGIDPVQASAHMFEEQLEGPMWLEVGELLND